MSASFKAFITRDGSELVMISGDWRLRCPAADLPKWLRFYRSMWSRLSKIKDGPGPYAAHYETEVRVLGDLAKKLGGA